MPNVYYKPEAFGLELIAEIDFDNGCSYSFDIAAVWREIATGVLFTARDEGCSCPSPFETFTTLADLERVGPDFEASIRAEALAAKTPQSDVEDFLMAVRNAQRAKVF